MTIGCVGAALVVRNDTSDLQARAEPLDREVRELIASEHNAEHRLRTLQSQSRTTAAALAALLGAAQAQVEASNHAVDVANQAVDQYNNGQTDVAAAFQAAGDAAISDLEARTTAVHNAVSSDPARDHAIAGVRWLTLDRSGDAGSRAVSPWSSR